MDHRSESSASAWLILVLLLIIGTYATGQSSRNDITCLRSIKESLEDPLNKISSWQFDNLTDGFLCSFYGVQCWSDARILNIRLSGMGLRGEFPQGIANCSALTGLDLSNNHLYGSIPSNISKLIPFVTSLDLSSNNFSGEIPPEIANCSYLNSMLLNNNLLTGQIPASLPTLGRLKYFTVANNLLSGPVPKFSYTVFFPYATFPPESYANNTGLCGYPLDPCETGNAQKNLFIDGFFVGWAVFFVLVVSWLTPVWKFIIKYIKRLVMETPRLGPLPSRERMDYTVVEMLERFATRMSFLELSKATDNFSQNNVIAIGETGTTFKAIVSTSGWCLAVKMLWAVPHIEHEFLSEIMTLGRLRHRNLVPLLGFCHELDARFLIYKFMPNGSLHDCLFSFNGEAKIIDWAVRVRIALGVAKGIAWLHQERVVHRGINSKCILLDEDFNPRISDFGKATTPNGTDHSSIHG